MDSLSTLAYCVTFFSMILVLGIYAGGARNPASVIMPNSPLEPLIAAILKTNTVGTVPWMTRGAGHINRSRLNCKESNCTDKAYAVTLPDAAEWLNPDYMHTGIPQYPVATVVIIPKTIASTFFYDTSESGLVPMILQDNSPYRGALNVTGNFVGAFVLFNQSSKDILFCQTSFSENMITTESAPPLTYWLLSPGSKTLMWQTTPYWNNPNRPWLAASLPNVSVELAAYIAETMMYDVIAPLQPDV